MAKQIQVHLTTNSSGGTINKVEWVDESLKLKDGMTAPAVKGDPRVWIVLHAYPSTPREGL